MAYETSMNFVYFEDMVARIRTFIICALVPGIIVHLQAVSQIDDMHKSLLYNAEYIDYMTVMPCFIHHQNTLI